MPEELLQGGQQAANRCLALSHYTRSNSDHGQLLRRGTTSSSSSTFRAHRAQAAISLSRCANIWIETSSAAQGSSRSRCE